MNSTYLAIATIGMMQSSLLASLPTLIDKTPITALQWSWLLAFSMFGFVIFAPVWGKLTDRYGYDRTLMWTFIGAALSNILLLVGICDYFNEIMPWIVIVTVLTMSRLIHACFASGIFGAAQAKVVSIKPDSIKSSLARIQAFNQVGRMAGPLVVAIGALVFSTFGLYLVGGLVAVLAALFMFSSQKTSQAASSINPTNSNTEQNPDWLSGLPDIAMAILLTMFVGWLQFSLGPYIQNLWGLNPTEASQELSYLLFASAFAMSVTAFLITPRISHMPKLYAAIMISCVIIGAVILSRATSLLQLYPGMILLSVGLALCPPYYGHRLRARWPHHQGLIGGVLTSAHTIGYACGVLLGGWLLNQNPSQVLELYSIFGPLLLAIYIWQTLLFPIDFRYSLKEKNEF